MCTDHQCPILVLCGLLEILGTFFDRQGPGPQSRAKSPILPVVSPLEPPTLQKETEVALSEMVQSELCLQGQVLQQEAPLALLPSSSSSLDDSVVPDFFFPVLKNFKSYQDLLRWMAMTLDIQAELVQENTHRLVDILQLSAPARVTVPIKEVLLKLTKTLWHTSAS